MGSTARYHQFFKFVNITTGKTYLLDDIAGSLSEATSGIDDLKDKLSKIASAYVYQGSKPTIDDLPKPPDVENGWVYNVETDGMNYAWNGTAWDALGPTIDLTPYATLENLSEHALTTATSTITGYVILADNLGSSTLYAVPNAKTVKDYIDPKYSEFTSYKTETDATLGTLEQSIETNYTSLTSLVDTTSSSLLTSLTSYQQTTEDNLYVLSSAITGNYTSLYTTLTSVSSNLKTTIDSISQIVEDNYTTLEDTVASLSASVYNKEDIDEKFRTNKGYIILRDYNTIS